MALSPAALKRLNMERRIEQAQAPRPEIFRVNHAELVDALSDIARSARAVKIMPVRLFVQVKQRCPDTRQPWSTDVQSFSNALRHDPVLVALSTREIAVWTNAHDGLIRVVNVALPEPGDEARAHELLTSALPPGSVCRFCLLADPGTTDMEMVTEGQFIHNRCKYAWVRWNAAARRWHTQRHEETASPSVSDLTRINHRKSSGLQDVAEGPAGVAVPFPPARPDMPARPAPPAPENRNSIEKPREESGGSATKSNVPDIALAALREALQAHGSVVVDGAGAIPNGTKAVTIEEWRASFAACYGTTNAGAKRDGEAMKKAFQRAREKLLSSDAIGMSQGRAWLVAMREPH